MADNLTRNGLSIGAFTSTPGTAIPSIIPNGSRPADRIARAQASIQSVTLLQYPADLPKYYMGFQVYRYSRDSLLSVALLDQLNQICLPFPDQMVDSNQVAFDQVRFSATIGNAADAAFKGVSQVQNAVNTPGANNSSIAGAVGSAVGSGLGATAAGLGADALTALTGEQGRAVLGAAGYSPNYFLTVILNGPQYKQYTLNWTMAPRDPNEASTLTQIIRVFKDAQAPGLALGGALFSFPRVFQNYYAPNRGHLYQFKPSVLTSFSVNYTPAGMPSMKQADPALNNWNSPTALRISATFLELEFWLRGDYGDVTDGASSSQDYSNQIHPTPSPHRFDK